MREKPPFFVYISISHRLDGFITILSVEIAINGSVPSMLSYVMVYSLTIGPSRTPCFESLNHLYLYPSYIQSFYPLKHIRIPPPVGHRGPWPCSAPLQVLSPTAPPAQGVPPRCHGGVGARAPVGVPPGNGCSSLVKVRPSGSSYWVDVRILRSLGV